MSRPSPGSGRRGRTSAPTAVIDIGSNSIRLAVVTSDRDGHLEVLEEGRAVPRLIRDVRKNGTLSDASIEAVLATLRTFSAIARSAGASRVVAVATSAVRDASNSHELVARAAEELGLGIEVIAGTREAEFAFLGAVHGLPVVDGLVIDVGGGSMEVVQFQGRRLRQSWTLPLGSVRLTDEFALEDPPGNHALAALSRHAAQVWQAQGIPSLAPGAQFVGTGGTVRNLAKLDRAAGKYPMPRLHGYVLAADRLRALADTLGRSAVGERADMQGLNPDRADTIVAGAVAVLAVLEASGASDLLVSGQGLREGVALEATGHRSAPLARIRATTVARLNRRFGTSASAIERRRGVLDALLGTCDLELPGEIEGALYTASALLDLGRSVDYYTRHRQTEAILAAHGLPGFSHREAALTCALVRQAGSERYSALAYEPLVTPADMPALALASTLLAAADEAALSMAPDQVITHADRSAGRVALMLDGHRGQEIPVATDRFKRALGMKLTLSAAGPGGRV